VVQKTPCAKIMYMDLSQNGIRNTTQGGAEPKMVKQYISIHFPSIGFHCHFPFHLQQGQATEQKIRFTPPPSHFRQNKNSPKYVLKQN
jgi:hypothetical protein